MALSTGKDPKQYKHRQPPLPQVRPSYAYLLRRRYSTDLRVLGLLLTVLTSAYRRMTLLPCAYLLRRRYGTDLRAYLYDRWRERQVLALQAACQQ
eukprot:2084851-Rhodomonas_salina.2